MVRGRLEVLRGQRRQPRGGIDPEEILVVAALDRPGQIADRHPAHGRRQRPDHVLLDRRVGDAADVQRGSVVVDDRDHRRAADAEIGRRDRRDPHLERLIWLIDRVLGGLHEDHGRRHAGRDGQRPARHRRVVRRRLRGVVHRLPRHRRVAVDGARQRRLDRGLGALADHRVREGDRAAVVVEYRFHQLVAAARGQLEIRRGRVEHQRERLVALERAVLGGRDHDRVERRAGRRWRAERERLVGNCGEVLTADGGAVRRLVRNRRRLACSERRVDVQLVGNLLALPERALDAFDAQPPTVVVDDRELFLEQSLIQRLVRHRSRACDRERLVALHAVVLDGVDGERGLEVGGAERHPLQGARDFFMNGASVPGAMPTADMYVVICRRREGRRRAARRTGAGQQADPRSSATTAMGRLVAPDRDHQAFTLVNLL